MMTEEGVCRRQLSNVTSCQSVPQTAPQPISYSIDDEDHDDDEEDEDEKEIAELTANKPTEQVLGPLGNLIKFLIQQNTFAH